MVAACQGLRWHTRRSTLLQHTHTPHLAFVLSQRERERGHTHTHTHWPGEAHHTHTRHLFAVPSFGWRLHSTTPTHTHTQETTLGVVLPCIVSGHAHTPTRVYFFRITFSRLVKAKLQPPLHSYSLYIFSSPTQTHRHTDTMLSSGPQRCELCLGAPRQGVQPHSLVVLRRATAFPNHTHTSLSLSLSGAHHCMCVFCRCRVACCILSAFKLLHKQTTSGGVTIIERNEGCQARLHGMRAEVTRE